MRPGHLSFYFYALAFVLVASTLVADEPKQADASPPTTLARWLVSRQSSPEPMSCGAAEAIKYSES